MKVHLGQKYHTLIILMLTVTLCIRVDAMELNRVTARAEHGMGHTGSELIYTSLIFRIVMIVLWFPIVIHDRICEDMNLYLSIYRRMSFLYLACYHGPEVVTSLRGC